MSLLQLSRELRDLIYEHTFSHMPLEEDAVKPNYHEVGRISHCSTSHRAAPPMDHAFALLYVNHQISAEAISTLYRASGFTGCPCGFAHFLSSIGAHRHAIKTVTIRTHFPDQEHSCHSLLGQTIISLSDMKDLRSIVIDCEHPTFPDVQKALIACDIDKLPSRVNVVVNNEYHPRGPVRRSPSLFKCNNTWKCAKGDDLWTGGENQWRLDRKWCEGNQRWVEAGA